MKYIKLLIIFLLLFFNFFPIVSSSMQWSEEIKLTNTQNANLHLPSIGIDSNFNIHIVYANVSANNSNISYMKFNENSNIIIKEKTLKKFISDYGFSYLPSSFIYIDKDNTVHLIFESEYPLSEGATIYSTYMKLDINGNILLDLMEGYSKPKLVIDSNKNVHIVSTYWDDVFRETTIYTKLDENGNKIIEREIRIEGQYNPYYNPNIAIDKSDLIYIVHIYSTQIYYTKLSNNGTTLINETKLTFSGNSINPQILSDSLNNLHIIYQDYENNNSDLYYMKLNNNGTKIINETRLTFSNYSSENPSIAIDKNDNIHLTWQSNKEGNWEIYYMLLSSNGNIIINETRLSYADRNSTAPKIAVNSENIPYIVWQDDRDGNYEIYMKYLLNNYLKLPDLIPSTLNIHQNYYENQQTTISSLIKNLGNANATNFTVSLIINNNFIENKTISLLANSSQQVNFNWTVLRGNHEIKIVLDKENKIIELNEGNNEIKKYISILPDLIPILYTSHEMVLERENMTIFALIKNIGNAKAENFTVKFYIDKKEVKNFTISLNFNENKTLSFNYNFEKGNHTIKVFVDENNFIEELNEENNNASFNIFASEKTIQGNSFYINLFLIILTSFLIAIIKLKLKNKT